MRKKALAKQPFAYHLAEFRTRLFIILIDFILGSIIGYYFSKQLTDWFLYPLHQSVYYTSPVGGFNLVLSVSMLIGIFFAIPTMLYQSFLFIKPLLPSSLTHKAPFVIIASFILLLLGISFVYFIALPVSLHFFSTFGTGEVKSLINANEYLSFVIRYFIGFGSLFQLPLVLLVINAITKLSVKKLLSYQRYFIVVAFLIGAILSPDSLTMALMAVPIILLYYFSIILVWLVNNKGKKRDVKFKAKKNEISF
ncbi:MAG TPA: twin-arginine translocase subunit TatC [Patescibacteria group bacterium]